MISGIGKTDPVPGSESPSYMAGLQVSSLCHPQQELRCRAQLFLIVLTASLFPPLTSRGTPLESAGDASFSPLKDPSQLVFQSCCTLFSGLKDAGVCPEHEKISAFIGKLCFPGIFINTWMSF